jgi:hypothetical protein
MGKYSRSPYQFFLKYDFYYESDFRICEFTILRILFMEITTQLIHMNEPPFTILYSDAMQNLAVIGGFLVLAISLFW